MLYLLQASLARRPRMNHQQYHALSSGLNHSTRASHVHDGRRPKLTSANAETRQDKRSMQTIVLLHAPSVHIIVHIHSRARPSRHNTSSAANTQKHVHPLPSPRLSGQSKQVQYPPVSFDVPTKFAYTQRDYSTGRSVRSHPQTRAPAHRCYCSGYVNPARPLQA